MTVDEASSAVTKMGAKLGAATRPTERVLMLPFSRGSKEWDFLHFCDDKLVGYQSDIAGGTATFLRAAAREHDQRGPGRFIPRAQETSVGQWLTLEVKWPDGRDEFTLGLSVVDEEEQVYMRYESPNPCEGT